MSDEASTSKDESSWEVEKSKLLQQALSQAGANRAQKQKKIARPLPDSLPTSSVDDRTKIQNHPLMPVVKLLLEKCEASATCIQNGIFNMNDVVQLFLDLEQQGVSPVTDDPSIDKLMWDASIVLRTQLAELQKVSVLADDFHSKYIGSLRRRVSSDVLIGASLDSDDEGQGSSTPEMEASSRYLSGSIATITTADGIVSIPLQIPPDGFNRLSTPSYKQNEEKKPTPPKFDFTSIERSSMLDSSTTPTEASRFMISHLPWLAIQQQAVHATSQRRVSENEQTNTDKE